jgi:hypothetical protein
VLGWLDGTEPFEDLTLTASTIRFIPIIFRASLLLLAAYHVERSALKYPVGEIIISSPISQGTAVLRVIVELPA